MKKLIFIFTVSVAAFSLQAQAQQTYTQMFDSLFNNVPYSTVSSGICLNHDFHKIFKIYKIFYPANHLIKKKSDSDK
jgi:hypothetical protein